jgi:hypothetical protein
MDYIHDDLRVDATMSFLVIYRASGALYFTKIDDPFYSAHTECHYAHLSGYCPDREATALGCLEQYQYCVEESKFCTTWGFRQEQFSKVKQALEKENDAFSLMDIWVFETARSALSVHNYLSVRQGEYRPLPLMRQGLMENTGDQKSMYEKEAWVAEVHTWFMKNILESIMTLQMGGRHEMRRSFEHHTSNHSGSNGPPGAEHSSCDRILFRNSDYTNINWVGLWLTIALLSLLCISSYGVKYLHKIASTVVKKLNKIGNFLWTKLVIASRTLKSFPRTRRWRNDHRPWSFFSGHMPHFWSRFDKAEAGKSVRGSRSDEEAADGAISLQNSALR